MSTYQDTNDVFCNEQLPQWDKTQYFEITILKHYGFTVVYGKCIHCVENSAVCIKVCGNLIPQNNVDK